MIGDLFDSPWKILIVAVVLIVLFGSRKLPDAARSLGKSMRILKREVRDLREDDDEQQPAQAITAQPAQPAQPTQAQVDALQQQLRDLQQQKADAAQGAPVETPRTQAS
ncbi:MAG TPA: Sec-independent protein translocase subunit TatA [Streptosporangiaceae bacterium]|jgi:sec-independent protein translocase protein TatA